METAIGIAIGLIAGVPLSLLGGYWLFVLQRKKRELGYEVLSSNVLIPGPPEATPDIAVMVRNRLIDPDRLDPEKFSEVDEVRGFRVLLKNTGNEPLEEQVVTLDLGEPAVTLSASVESQPDLGLRSIVVETQFGSPHRTRITIPFLNPHNEVVVSLQSIKNEGKACLVSAGTPGLNYYDLGQRHLRNYIILTGSMLVIFIASMGAVLAVSIVYSGQDPKPLWLSFVQWGGVPGLALFALSFATFLPEWLRGRQR